MISGLSRVNEHLLAQTLARQHLVEFAEYTDANYTTNWHHRVLCEKLDKLVAKKIKRLMVFMPPRHGKSELVSRKLPAFIFGRNPDASIMATSYSADLAQRMSRDVQRIIDSPKYGELFPETSLYGKNIRTVANGSYLRNSDIFEIVGYKGSYRGAGVGGGITGMGGDYIIVDDPVKNREDVNSLVMRDKLWDWYTSTLYTRREKDAAILITLTRWHEDDLAGRLLELAQKEPNADQWEVLMFPAMCEEERKHPEDIREDGMALWPDKYTYAELVSTKATVGIYDWSALYQQRPQPAGGTIFQREWMNKEYEELPAGATLIQTWDLPFKDSEASAKCAGIIMARKGAEIFFVDVVNDKMSFTTSVTAIRSMTAKHPKARAKVVEDKANGPAIINYLQKEIPGMIAFNPKGSKEDRALSVAPYFEAGNVYFPKYAPWKADLISDLIRFPTGVYKDTVDASVQGILYLMDKPNDNLGDSSLRLNKNSYWKR
ncbi:MAG: phage terminase large subunit [Clostridiales bacterium]|jgi:predicted phage terminase large subunit-like protein|nr:phage terminase large subunit [Clostridiales bacterium]